MDNASENANRRWRYIAIGLALVGATNMVNMALNAAGLRDNAGVSCIAIVGDNPSAEKAIEQRVNGGARRFRIP